MGVHERGVTQRFPIILTSGRLVEYEGGGEETRSNRWLAELQQSMFAEVNPADAERLGITDGTMVWVYAPRTTARPGSAPWSPSGSARARCSCRSTSPATGRATACENYPPGTDPIVLGEPATG